VRATEAVKAVCITGVVVVSSIVTPGASASHGSAGLDPTQHPCVPNVEGQFRALKHHGEALGFHLGANTPVPNIEKHYQGIQRLPGAGTPYFFVSKNGNPTSPRTTEEGHLLVVRMGSRPTEGERLRSNRLFRDAHTINTPPPLNDVVVSDISFSAPGFEYAHAGGMQVWGDVLVVALDKPMSGSLPTGKIAFFDVSDPASPVFMYDIPVNHDAATAAVTRLRDGRYLVAVGGANDSQNVYTYLSNGADIHDTNIIFTEYDVWRNDELTSGHWPTGTESHQTLNFLSQCDGTLFLAGTNNDNPLAPDSDDFTDLYSVGPIDGSNLRLQWVARRHIFCESEAGRLCNFAAAAGFYISPTGELILYGAEHHNDSSHGSVGMAEFRHQDLFRGDSPLWAPTADARGPYSVPEGGTVTLDGGGTRPPSAQAWAEFYDDNSVSDRSVVFDYADRHLDNWEEFDKLDHFTDKTTSMIWTAPAGCDIVLFQDDHFAGDPYRLVGDGTIRSILNFTAFGVSSARFEGSNCDATGMDFTWNIGANWPAVSAPTARFDASQIDGPWTHHASLKACGAFYGCSESGARIEITNVAPVGSINSIEDEWGQVIGQETDTVLAGLGLSLDGTFADAGRPDTHTATIDWEDGASQTEADFDGWSDSTGGVIGTVTASHSFSEAGTYQITLTLRDDDGGVGSESRSIRVVSAAELLAETVTQLETVASDPLLLPSARAHVSAAIDKLENAIDRLKDDRPVSALALAHDAVAQLIKAEAARSGLDLSLVKDDVTRAAKSVAMVVISTSQGSDRLQEARAEVEAGDASFSSGGHLAAIDHYRKALLVL